MSLPPTKPKFTSGERRNRQTDKLTMIRLHVAIGRALDDLGSTTPKGHW